MDSKTLNQKLLQPHDSPETLFPVLLKLKEIQYLLKVDFGLKKLPEEPGILLIRGARQYGKSTWLAQSIVTTLKQFGPGSAFYLNGEDLLDPDKLEKAIAKLVASFPKHVTIRRLFIDEITAVPGWELALKKLADNGVLTSVLVVTTGSKATDLRRGSEKLPGRKGRLARTKYLFTPISYREFHRVCHTRLGEKTLLAYLLSGGSPIACNELAIHGRLPEFLIELIRDWIDGEIATSGRSRSALLNAMKVIMRWGGTPIGQAKLAREAGLANNTTAAGYIEILNDLGCITPAYPWDKSRDLIILRKPCKYHFTNLLALLAYNPARIRTIEEFEQLPKNMQGIWYEWLISQELLRRTAIAGEEILAPQAFWQTPSHELDFVVNAHTFIEVKRGASNPIEFAWFSQQFPKEKLLVINANTYETNHVLGITFEKFLMEDY